MNQQSPAFGRTSNTSTLPPSTSSTQRGCLRAFFITLGLFFVVALAAGIYIYRNFESLMRTGGAAVLEASVESMLKEGTLSPQEQEKIRSVIHDFAEKIRNEKVSAEQAQAVFENLTNGALMPFILLASFEIEHLVKSNLSADEKSEGKKTVRRFLEALVEGVITEEEFESATSPFLEQDAKDPDGKPASLKKNLTSAEVRSVLSTMKTLADREEIALDLPPFDIAQTLQDAIAAGMATGSEAPPEVSPEP